MSSIGTPVGAGNELAVTHGLWITRLSPEDAKIAQGHALWLWDRISPRLQVSATEPQVQATALKLWRRDLVIAYLSKKGVSGGRGHEAVQKNLTSLENSIRQDFKTLAITAQAAADLGLTLLSVQRGSIDASRLSPEKQEQLRDLLHEAGLPREASDAA